MTLTAKEADILAHTSNNGRYVTGDAFVFDLARRGLLYDHGTTSFWPEDTHGFTLSPAGREALREWRAAQPKPHKPKRRPQTVAFEAWRSFCENYKRISFSEFWREVWPHRENYR